MNGSSTDAEAPGLARQARQLLAPVVEQAPLARDTWRLRLSAPELAAAILPGQFVMLREPGVNQPLLGRPFALYDVWHDTAGRPAGIDIVYLVVGRMTSRMAELRSDDVVEIWGPLGNGFPPPPSGHLLMVAGGIGQTPFLAVAREALGLQTYGGRGVASKHLPSSVTLLYGARSASYLAGVSDFERLGIDPRLATDDGSRGHAGFVTDLLRSQLDDSRARPDSSKLTIYACGPEPMMEAVARLAHARGVTCWLSLETPMACGFGACFSCVTRVREGSGWDYRRVCVEGPIFLAENLWWDGLSDSPPGMR